MNYSKGAKMRAKKVKVAQAVATERPNSAVRPTPERQARGIWNEPRGMGKNEIPVTDVANDAVGYLLHRKAITHSQEQAARQFQAMRAAYMQEIPDVGRFKSCLAGDVPGYDDGDGDAQIIEAYRAIERKVGRDGLRELIWVCEDNTKPRRIDVLRAALNTIGGV